MSATSLTVIQVLPALVSGGVERGTLEIARALVAAGHRSIVASAGGPLTTQLVAAGSEHVTLPLDRKNPLALAQVSGLRQLLKAVRPDVVHARSRLPAWLAWLALRPLPIATRPHFVTTVHGLYSVNRYSAIMTRGDAVIAVSETARQYILANYPRCPEDRITVIPRGVAAAEFPHGHRPEAAWTAAWYQSHPALREAVVVTIAGRITRRKGHAALLNLIAALRGAGIPAHGLIVGPAAKAGLQRDLRRAIAAQRLDDAITFAGARDDMREVLASSDLVVSLSTQPESFGRTTLEALALGVPVLGWAHGGVGEILANVFPEGGVPLGDETALAQRADDLLRRRVRPAPLGDRFALERMCQNTIEVYNRLKNGDVPR